MQELAFAVAFETYKVPGAAARRKGQPWPWQEHDGAYTLVNLGRQTPYSGADKHKTS